VDSGGAGPEIGMFAMVIIIVGVVLVAFGQRK
jgi:hypothetical protein